METLCTSSSGFPHNIFPDLTKSLKMVYRVYRLCYNLRINGRSSILRCAILLVRDVAEVIWTRLRPLKWLAVAKQYLCFILPRDYHHYWYQISDPGRIESLVGVGGKPIYKPGIGCTWESISPPNALQPAIILLHSTVINWSALK